MPGSRTVTQRPLAPTAPSRKQLQRLARAGSASVKPHKAHPLADQRENALLIEYEERIKGCFDRIVPLLQKLASLQREPDFSARAQGLARAQLGFMLPQFVLDQTWVEGLDMKRLYAWCVFRAYEAMSRDFFGHDPLRGARAHGRTRAMAETLLNQGFHLLDISPCADGRLAHTVSSVLRLPYGLVRRRSHAGAMFDVSRSVNRWVGTEHRRFREAVPNAATEPTRYLKVVVYHFSSLDSAYQGCAAHGSDDAAAAAAGLQRLQDFRQAIENGFCCGASVGLLLIGMDTDTDAIRVHVPASDHVIDLLHWLDGQALYEDTSALTPRQGRELIGQLVADACLGRCDEGMQQLIALLLEHNISQVDLVRSHFGGAYSDAGHAERFIGVGIGFKEVHLRNLTYFAHLGTVEEAAADLDVGIKIFRGLNVSRGLPIPVVVRFDYSGSIPGARERAIADCHRVRDAMHLRYADLCDRGLLHTLLSIRDRDRGESAETIATSILLAPEVAH